MQSDPKLITLEELFCLIRKYMCGLEGVKYNDLPKLITIMEIQESNPDFEVFLRKNPDIDIQVFYRMAIGEAPEEDMNEIINRKKK